eukprot:14824803-Alexandrium_andersonii.AAC.1
MNPTSSGSSLPAARLRPSQAINVAVAGAEAATAAAAAAAVAATASVVVPVPLTPEAARSLPDLAAQAALVARGEPMHTDEVSMHFRRFRGVDPLMRSS